MKYFGFFILKFKEYIYIICFFPDPPCLQPKHIEHGITDWDGRSSFAKYACYQGYHLVGPPAIECRYGRWYSDAPATYPTCKPIVCNYPVIANGHLETGDNVR